MRDITDNIYNNPGGSSGGPKRGIDDVNNTQGGREGMPQNDGERMYGPEPFQPPPNTGGELTPFTPAREWGNGFNFDNMRPNGGTSNTNGYGTFDNWGQFGNFGSVNEGMSSLMGDIEFGSTVGVMGLASFRGLANFGL